MPPTPLPPLLWHVQSAYQLAAMTTPWLAATMRMPDTMNSRVMLQAVIAGLVLATIGMIAAAFNLIPVVVGAFLQEAIDVVSILWALTALIDRD